MGSDLGLAAAFPVVKNEPYTANVLMRDVSIALDGKRTLHEALNIHVRDSAGRLRDQQLATPPDANGTSTQATVHILDPVSMQDIQWNMDTKTVVIGAIPATFANYKHSPIFACTRRVRGRDTDPDQTEFEDLGTRPIEGIQAKGCRITQVFHASSGSSQAISSVMEIWDSPELQINLLVTERNSDGTARLTQITNIRRHEPDSTLFQVPEGYADPTKVKPSVQNTNSNYALIREYGRIEWHGNTAELVAGGSRPLDFAAMTLSTCLGVSVNSEDPHYRYLGDLLDVTAPQWAAQHPGVHAYAAKPGEVDVTFNLTADGSPADLSELIQDAAKQVNQQQPYAYQVRESGSVSRPVYSFVPTSSHNEEGVLEQIPAYLNQKITIAHQTARIADFAQMFTRALTAETGMSFDCCQSFVAGQFWGMQTIAYEATDKPARSVLEDLIEAAGGSQGYSVRCTPMDKRFCFIEVSPAVNRIPTKAQREGVCSVLGYDGY
jgi:hypothetical protein